MCFDPVSIGLMAGGSGLSFLGGSARQKAQSRYTAANIEADMEQARQNHEEALARNRVLDEFMKRQDTWTSENRETFDKGTNAFKAENQTKSLEDSEKKRGDAMLAALATPSETVTPTQSDNVLQKDLDQRISAALTENQNKAGRLAKLGAYGDSMQDNQTAIGDADADIRTTNTIARGNLALLPGYQDLEGFQYRKPIWRPGGVQTPSWADWASTFGNFAGAAGGSGKFSSGFNWSNSSGAGK